MDNRDILAVGTSAGGVMWEIEEDELIRYRCHVGHTYTADTMHVALDENLRRALGSALRALEERVALAEKLETQAQERGHRTLVTTWGRKAREAQKELDVVRDAIIRIDHMAAEEELKRTA